jgi:hypothetical protein
MNDAEYDSFRKLTSACYIQAERLTTIDIIKDVIMLTCSPEFVQEQIWVPADVGERYVAKKAHGGADHRLEE